jgi:prepilin-type N-terminal cleavage/methylation domain-containing protein
MKNLRTLFRNWGQSLRKIVDQSLVTSAATIFGWRSAPVLVRSEARTRDEVLVYRRSENIAGRCARNGRTPVAFTLIELLIVIAIISILAALIFPVTGAVNRNKIRSKARTELTMVQMAIENYKSKMGHYPPDNPGRPSTNQLYFELLGCTNLLNGFATLDGSGQVLLSPANEFQKVFAGGVSGFVNCVAATGGDEARQAGRFIPGDLKPGEIGSWAYYNYPNVKFLICSIPWPDSNPSTSPLGVVGLNPFRYNSSNPTNNPNTYDLWVDVIIAGKTNRISNWSRDPIIVGVP